MAPILGRSAPYVVGRSFFALMVENVFGRGAGLPYGKRATPFDRLDALALPNRLRRSTTHFRRLGHSISGVDEWLVLWTR